MRVSIYRLEGGGIDVMVEASMGNRRAPVVLRGLTRQDLVARVGPVIVAQRGRRELDQGPARD